MIGLRGSSLLWHDHLLRPVIVCETTLRWYTEAFEGAAILSSQRRIMRHYILLRLDHHRHPSIARMEIVRVTRLGKARPCDYARFKEYHSTYVVVRRDVA